MLWVDPSGSRVADDPDGELWALRDLDLSVPAGSVLGLR
jgi:hypothetical protein